MPSGITSVPDALLASCANLNTFDFDTITEVGRMSFQNTGFQDIVLNTVQTIGKQGFCECANLTTVTISTAITYIAAYAFYKCSGLTSFTIQATTPPTLEDYSAFWDTQIDSGTGSIYVPSESVNAYKTATNWSRYASRIQAIGS